MAATSTSVVQLRGKEKQAKAVSVAVAHQVAQNCFDFLHMQWQECIQLETRIMTRKKSRLQGDEVFGKFVIEKFEAKRREHGNLDNFRIRIARIA